MKTVPIEQAVEQANSTKVFAYGGWGRSTEPPKTMLAPLQPRPHGKILSRSACTEAQNYDIVFLRK